MRSGRYKIAEKVFEINTLYDSTHFLCLDYVTDETPDHILTVKQSDIDFERVKAIESNPDACMLPDSSYEQSAVNRKIADAMIDHDTLLMHGSAVAVDGKAYLFLADSGTGKSTHTRLWREYFKERAIMVNDDKPLVKASEKIIVYGTPFNGKHNLGSNIAVPLKAICFLSRAKENSIRQLDANESFPLLFSHTYRSADAEKMIKTMELLDSLTEKIKFYDLRCNMDISAAEIAYNGMNR